MQPKLVRPSPRAGPGSRCSTRSAGARAIDRLVLAAQEPAHVRKQRRQLHVLESMYCKARQHGDIVTGCAVTYFRAQALQDADHPDFLGEWI